MADVGTSRVKFDACSKKVAGIHNLSHLLVEPAGSRNDQRPVDSLEFLISVLVSCRIAEENWFSC